MYSHDGKADFFVVIDLMRLKGAYIQYDPTIENKHMARQIVIPLAPNGIRFLNVKGEEEDTLPNDHYKSHLRCRFIAKAFKAPTRFSTHNLKMIFDVDQLSTLNKYQMKASVGGFGFITTDLTNIEIPPRISKRVKDYSFFKKKMERNKLVVDKLKSGELDYRTYIVPNKVSKSKEERENDREAYNLETDLSLYGHKPEEGKDIGKEYMECTSTDAFNDIINGEYDGKRGRPSKDNALDAKMMEMKCRILFGNEDNSKNTQ